MMLEKHRLAMEMLKDAILDDSFESYSPLVQKALMTQLDFHRQWGMRSTEDPNNFDDDVEKLESLQMEQFLAAAEADLETPEGTFAL
jgi:predicted metal-dependent TIM-barrel fold hydrolase